MYRVGAARRGGPAVPALDRTPRAAALVGGTNPCNSGVNLSGSWRQGHSTTYNTRSRLSRLQRIQLAAWRVISIQGIPRPADVQRKGSASDVSPWEPAAPSGNQRPSNKSGASLAWILA